MTKKELYDRVEQIRERMGIKPEHYPLDSVNICDRVKSLTVDYLPFKTPGLQGVILLQRDCDSLIILNSKRNRVEQNFYCAHELAHFILHRNHPSQSFQCFDRIRDKQNAFQEWQANEWAAEFLVPYRLFIPELFKRLDWNLPPEVDFYPPVADDRFPLIRQELARLFGVSERVIRNRIESLKFEILQHYYGEDISEIRVLSLTQQQKRGIKVLSMNEPEKPFKLNRKALDII